MATLIENAAEVATCATAIDAAIVAKGGSTAGGLRNAATGIASIVTGRPYIVIESTAGSTLQCGSETYTLTGTETSHAFAVSNGEYVCIASLSGKYAKTVTVSVSDNTAYFARLIPSSVPSGYQAVEYIESTGSQYIDTEKALDYQYDWELRCKFESLSTSGGEVGIISNWISSPGWVNAYMAGGRVSVFYNGSLSFSSVADDLYLRVDATNNMFYATANGVDTVSKSVTPSANGTSVKIFCRGDLLNKAKMRLFSASISSNNVSLGNYIPCYRKSDLAAGLYNTIDDSFIENAGSGVFTVGPDVE